MDGIDRDALLVPMSAIDDDPEIPPGVKKLVHDLCADRGGNYNFPCCGLNALTPLFYMNTSKEPNVGIGGEVFFQTLRNIKEGEELTVNYELYSGHNDLS